MWRALIDSFHVFADARRFFDPRAHEFFRLGIGEACFVGEPAAQLGLAWRSLLLS